MTVITPPEHEALRSFLSIHEINQMAEEFHIQNVDVYPICIGRASQGNAVVYYLLLESIRLREFRNIVFSEAVQRGMCPSHMDPDGLHFHITLGYKVRDLHSTDLIFKTPRTCFAGLNISL